MQSFNIVKTINRKITSSDAGNIITLFDNSSVAIPNRITLNGFVKNLKAFSKISSLAPINLPVFLLEDTESQKLYKTLDVEFNSPRKQMDVYIGTGTDWSQIGSVSLLNPSGYPYRTYNLLDFFTDGLAAEIGEDGKVGIAIADVGYGFLSGADTVTIHGSYVQEYVLNNSASESQTSTIVLASTVDSTTSTVVLLPANPDRVGATIFNDSATDLLIDFDEAITTPIAVRIMAEAYYEVPFGYAGIITGKWVTLDPDGKAVIREFI
jgi:hypothetical protein